MCNARKVNIDRDFVYDLEVIWRWNLVGWVQPQLVFERLANEVTKAHAFVHQDIACSPPKKTREWLVAIFDVPKQAHVSVFTPAHHLIGCAEHAELCAKVGEMIGIVADVFNCHKDEQFVLILHYRQS